MRQEVTLDPKESRILAEYTGHEPIPKIAKGTYVGFHIAFFDIETWGLNAGVHPIFCAAIADQWGRVTLFSSHDKRYYVKGDPRDDVLLARAIRDELEHKYDIVVTWNGAFDLSHLNGRLVRKRQRPVTSDLMHIDLMHKHGKWSRWQSNTGRKLKHAAEAYGVNGKTELEWEMWERAKTGDPKAVKYIEEHCTADVLTTRDMFSVDRPLIRNIHR